MVHEVTGLKGCRVTRLILANKIFVNAEFYHNPVTL